MQVRELIQPSSTCDVRGHLAPVSTAPAPDEPSVSVDDDLRTAADEMKTGRTSSLLVLDGGGITGLIRIEDLLRGALESGDHQLCRDLVAQLDDPATWAVPLT